MPTRPAPLQVKLIEPVIFLRSTRDTIEQDNTDITLAQDEIGKYKHLDDDNLNQLRGLVLLNHDRLPSDTGRILISFHGVSVWVEWYNKVPKNCLREIVSYTFTIPIDSAKTAGLSSIPFSIPIPFNLPPSVDADYGSNRYAVTAAVDAPTFKQSITAEAPVRLDLARTQIPFRGSERVERTCYDDKVQYSWTADQQVCIGAPLSMSLSLLPLTQECLSIGYLRVILEESTICTAANSTEKPVVRRWPLCKLQPMSPNTLLPWTGHTGCCEVDAALLSAAQLYYEKEQSDSKPSLKSAEEVQADIKRQLGDSAGPWNLSWKVTSPSCSQTAINNSIKHPKSAITVSHRLVLQLLIRGPGGTEDGIELTRPIEVLSNYLAQTGSALPCYWCDHLKEHPYHASETWRQVAAQESSPSTSTTLPTWLSRLINIKRDSPSTDDEGLHKMQSSREWLDLSSQGNSISAAAT